MSYYGLVTIELIQRPVSYTSIVRAYLDNGWIAGNGNAQGEIGVHYRDDDQSKTSSFKKERLGDAFRELERLEQEEKDYTFDMSWGGEYDGITFRNDPDERMKLFIRLRPSQHVMTGFEPYSDHSWYIPKLLTPLIKIGCWIDNITWHESP